MPWALRVGLPGALRRNLRRALVRQRLREIVEERKPAFVLMTGDLIEDALRVPEAVARGYYELYRREMPFVQPG